ncbi:MAG TPA: hypothetical protein ENK91_12495 [Bacteroidetes bacterium]|nr:hypothetical protein [Bacteroidota bacterium]
MKIHSIAFFIMLPFLILVLYTGYHVFFMDDNSMFPYLLVFAIISTIIYLFSPQIDFAWYSNYPKDFSQKERTFLSSISTFYNSLEEKDRLKFEQRSYVFIRSKDFKLIMKERKEMPEDMKLVVATNAIQVAFHSDNYLYKKYDRYFAYGHEFPTPDKKFLHSVEVNHDDKIAIFNMDVLVKSLNFENRIFNIGLFAFIDIFLHINKKSIPDLPETTSVWQKITDISSISKNDIINTIGYEPSNIINILYTVFFMYPENSMTHFPEQYEVFSSIFKIQNK